MDPFHAFASYPTHTLTPQVRLALVDADLDQAFQRTSAYQQLAMVEFAKTVLPGNAEVRTLLTAAAAGTKTAGELVSNIPAERQAFVFRGIAWLVKLGILRKVT
jgi:hypothetical protein